MPASVRRHRGTCELSPRPQARFLHRVLGSVRMVKHTQRQVPRGLDQRFDQRGKRGVVTRLRSIDQVQALLP